MRYLKWANRYDAGIGDRGMDITVNSLNDVLVGGQSHSIITFFKFQYLVLKYHSLGGQIWVVNDGPFYDNVFKKIALDNNGNIYLAGETNENDPGHYFYDFVLMKMNSSGITIWTRYYGLSNKGWK